MEEKNEVAQCEILPEISNDLSSESQIRFLKAKVRVLENEVSKLEEENHLEVSNASSFNFTLSDIRVRDRVAIFFGRTTNYSTHPNSCKKIEPTLTYFLTFPDSMDSFSRRKIIF